MAHFATGLCVQVLRVIQNELIEFQAQAENQRAQEHLAWWTAKRVSDPTQFATIPTLDFIPLLKHNQPRRVHQRNSSTNTVSIPSGGYNTGHLPFNSSSAISPSFSVSSPFFNSSNGTVVSPSLERAGSSQRDTNISIDRDVLSPTANNLIPSNLFRDEDYMSRLASNSAAGHNSSSSIGPDSFSGQGNPILERNAYRSYTPVSAGSRAGSLFSSPHDSSHNLLGYPLRTESFAEGDHQPMIPTSGPFHSTIAVESNTLAANRFTSLFTNFNRQRGKPSVHELPPLGTLKQGQSQSFPRNLDAETFDPNEHRRRRGSYGNWANPVAGLLNRNTTGSSTVAESIELIKARTGSGRRSRLNMFGSKFDNTESPVFADNQSSRPSSTYSYDLGLARPSSDSQRFGWPFSNNIQNRNSPLGAAWSAASGPWSRGPSRRPSVQHGSSSNLSIGSTPLESDGYQGSSANQVPGQLPIGTRPPSSQQPNVPKLNPTAPTFKTLFGRGDGKRSTKIDMVVERHTERLKDKDYEEIECGGFDLPHVELLLQNQRLSKDSRSVTTATSATDSHDSHDHSTFGTPSEALTSSGTKETLMQKISRKSSSSKFNIPWAKERTGLFSRRAGEPLTPDEIIEDASGNNQLDKSVDIGDSPLQQEKLSRTSLSWPNIIRKSKKSGQTIIESVERTSNIDNNDDFQ